MASSFHLTIIACDGVFYDGDCTSFIFPGTDGQVEILNHHEAMTGVIEIGDIKFRTPESNDWNHAIISDGLLTVYNDGSVKLLVYSCIKPEDMEKFREKEAFEREQEQLRQQESIKEYHMSTANMARAMARLKGAKENTDFSMF